MRSTLLTLFLISTVCFGQIGMNDWRIHFSVNSAVGVAAAGSDIYMAAENGIVNYDTDDESVNFLTVTNALSDLGISSLSGNDSLVIVGYGNGNLDIIDGNTVTNVPWIKLADLQGSKTVNTVYFDGDLAYVCTNIGLVLYDLSREEIRDTYYPYNDPSINDVTIYQDTLFVATPIGIYSAHKDAPFLNDVAQWTKKTNLPVELVSANISDIEAFDNKLVFAYDDVINFKADSIYYIQSGVLNAYSDNPVNIEHIRAEDNQLVVSLTSSIRFLDETMTDADLIYQYPDLEPPNPQMCIAAKGFYWMADGNNGLVRAAGNWDGISLFSNAPFTDGSFRMDIQYGKLLVAGGGLTHNLLNNYFRNGCYVFENETWTNFNHKTQDLMDESADWDFIAAAVNPNNTDEFAFAGFNKGGIKIVRDGATITDTLKSSNASILEETTLGNMVISDLEYDRDGNLWAINQGIEPLKCFAADGSQYSFGLGSAAKNKFPYRVLIDRNGVKWVALTNAGLVAYDDNGTIDDDTDDQMRSLTNAEGYGNLPSNLVKALAQDIDGEIWIGTEEGLVVLYSTTNLFDGGFGDYDASAILLEVDGEVEKLLGQTYITSIEVDGGNRKWIGTNSSGVFCLSPDGLTEIYRFSTDNSPLLSNNVLDIKIDHASGEVYFATDKGLVSFRADATIGDPQFDDVSIFPNPVRPEFAGPITIDGLGYQSDVKITDVSGNVVYKTVSNGGSVIWNGKTLQGNRVQTGVYLVWSGVSDGKGKEVGKILFIN